jgi:hypothetical protein
LSARPPGRHDPLDRPSLKDTNPVLRTFVLATIAVLIVIYGLMPRLHEARGRILARRAA